jgi:conjugative transfer region protein TrbK
MRNASSRIRAIARVAAYTAVASVIGATVLTVRHNDRDTPASARAPATGSDPLASELARCQTIGMAAKDDTACEAAWAENRRRFFTYRHADGAVSAQSSDRKPAARSEDQ